MRNLQYVATFTVINDVPADTRACGTAIVVAFAVSDCSIECAYSLVPGLANYASVENNEFGRIAATR
jgi:hypothetical protein